MGFVPTVKIKAGEDYIVINESDFEPETMTLFEAEARFYIVGKGEDGSKLYWDGEDFAQEPTTKTYGSDASASKAIASTKAIQESLDSGLVSDVRAEEVAG
jgi:hypothetical protein